MSGQIDIAPAQDEREAFEVEIPDISAIYDGRSLIPYRSLEAGERLMTVAQHLRIENQLRAALTRPAQTEQPDRYTIGDLTYEKVFKAAGLTNLSDMQSVLNAVETAIAQAAILPGSSGWISVVDRLPEPGVAVLVYSPPQPGDWPDSVRISFDGIDPESDGDYWVEHGEHYEHWCCIAKGGDDIDWHGPSEKAPYTHWMPMPAPPQ